MQCNACTITQVWLNEDDLKHILAWASTASRIQALSAAEAQTYHNLQTTLKEKFGASCPIPGGAK